jgi:predicted ribosomally synthesized peptide with SipW-like signal peptide
MKTIIKSALLVVGIAAIAGYATYSFFSDTETSTGNTFTAGAIDLKISNTSYVSNQTDGKLIASTSTTWPSDDLNNDQTTLHKFFDFADLKPGDVGEDTINLTVKNNNAWACAELSLTSNKDNDCTEPEKTNDTDCGNTDTNWNGDLAQGIEFVWWSDDGDNVLEKGEVASKYYLGPDTITHLLKTGNKLDLTIADADLNFFDRTNKLVDSSQTVNPITGGSTHYIGKGWCFGHMTLNPADEGTDNPIVRGTTGFICDGTGVNNAAQTDSLTADLKFYAVQSRNNMGFLCHEHGGPAIQ